MKRIIGFLGVLVIAVGLLVVPGRTISNEDFEGGTASWNTFNAIAQAMPGNRTGGSGLFFVNLTNISGGGSIYQTETNVDPGETWQITGWVKRNAGTINFGWYQTSFPYNPGPNNVTSAPLSVWTQLSVTQTFNAVTDDGYRDVQVAIGSGGSVDLDDFQTQLVSSVDDWCFY